MIRQLHATVKTQPAYPLWADCPYWQGFYLYSQGHNLSELPADDPAMRRGWWAACDAEAKNEGVIESDNEWIRKGC